MTQELIKRIKAEPDLYYAWQANIAIQMQDEFWRRKYRTLIDIEDDIHSLSNQAAKNFLDLLCYEPTE